MDADRNPSAAQGRCLCAERDLLGDHEEPCAGFGTRSDELCEQAEREAVAAGEWPPESSAATTELDRAITDIGVTILALRACDEAGEAVPVRLRAHIRCMESEWFNLPTPEGAQRREKLSDV